MDEDTIMPDTELEENFEVDGDDETSEFGGDDDSDDDDDDNSEM